MIEIKDLKIGEYYTHSNGNIFRWSNNISDFCLGNFKKNFYTNISFDSALRLATKQEKQWLDLCIKHNRFMPQPKFKQNIYELW
jgi:hypothetical protein